jgi:hypothetical protein
MSSGAALLRRVSRLEKQFDPPQPARQWSIILEEGEELSQELIAQLGPHDTLLVREYPRGYIRDEDAQSTRGQVMSSWINVGGGKKKSLVVRQYDVDISKV